MWIVTRFINQYDQEGGYFYAAFDFKPKIKDIEGVNHFGRKDWEEEWFELNEVRVGEVVRED